MTVNAEFTKVENVNDPFTGKEESMENIKLTIRAIAANEKISIEELAKRCDISPAHLKQVSAGNVRMLAEDLKKIADYTGIPADNITAC